MLKFSVDIILCFLVQKEKEKWEEIKLEKKKRKRSTISFRTDNTFEKGCRMDHMKVCGNKNLRKNELKCSKRSLNIKKKNEYSNTI